MRPVCWCWEGEKEEEKEEDVVVVGVVLEVLLMPLLRLWDLLFNDFSENTLIKNNWLPTYGRTDRPTDGHSHIEIRGRI